MEKIDNNKKMPHSNLSHDFRKNYFEQCAWAENQVICGIDEVGRGCLAGPLVTAAVILPPGTTYYLLKDSKIMSVQERLKAYAWITKNCWYTYGIVHPRIIDQYNVWHATRIAMKKALLHLLTIAPKRPQAVVIDAMPLELDDTMFQGVPVYYFPFGEQKSSSIAAASIIAKVKRDAIMEKLDILFPGYHLAAHKGYRTPAHKKVLFAHHHSLIHRVGYLTKLLLSRSVDYDEQQTIF
jgi:ribonuclease HII